MTLVKALLCRTAFLEACILAYLLTVSCPQNQAFQNKIYKVCDGLELAFITQDHSDYKGQKWALISKDYRLTHRGWLWLQARLAGQHQAIPSASVSLSPPVDSLLLRGTVSLWTQDGHRQLQAGHLSCLPAQQKEGLSSSMLPRKVPELGLIGPTQVTCVSLNQSLWATGWDALIGNFLGL